MDKKFDFKVYSEPTSVISSQDVINPSKDQSKLSLLKEDLMKSNINLDNITFSVVTELPDHEKEKVISALSLDEIAAKAAQEWEELIKEKDADYKYSNFGKLLESPKIKDGPSSPVYAEVSKDMKSDPLTEETSLIHSSEPKGEYCKACLSWNCFCRYHYPNELNSHFSANRLITSKRVAVSKMQQRNSVCSKIPKKDIEILFDSRESLSIVRASLSKRKLLMKTLKSKSIISENVYSSSNSFNLKKNNFLKELDLQPLKSTSDELKCVKCPQILNSKDIIKYLKNPIIPIHRVESLYKSIVWEDHKK